MRTRVQIARSHVNTRWMCQPSCNLSLKSRDRNPGTSGWRDYLCGWALGLIKATCFKRRWRKILDIKLKPPCVPHTCAPIHKIAHTHMYARHTHKHVKRRKNIPKHIKIVLMKGKNALYLSVSFIWMFKITGTLESTALCREVFALRCFLRRTKCDGELGKVYPHTSPWGDKSLWKG